MAAVATLWYAYLVWKTLVEMVAQRKEVQQQRLDSLRPAVVPIGPSELIEYLNSVSEGKEDRRQLTLRNIGPGPAFNVAVAVGIRRENGTLERDTQLNDFFSGVPDMASKELGTAVQWTVTQGVPFFQGQILTIVYDDIFGQSFRTTCHRVSADWRYSQIEQIPKRIPQFNKGAQTMLPAGA